MAQYCIQLRGPLVRSEKQESLHRFWEQRHLAMLERLPDRLIIANLARAMSSRWAKSLLSLKLAYPTKMRNHRHRQQAFTLVEMLVVCAIVALLFALSTPVVSAFKANTVSQGVYSVSDTIEQARTYAMSMNTYVYIGIVQDSSASPSGSMVIGVIASNDSTEIFSSTANLPQNPTSFKAISPLLKVTNLQTVSLPASSPTSGDARPVVPSSYKLGDPTFAQTLPTSSFSVGNYKFTSAPGPTGTSGVTSQGMLQIDPQGVVSEVGGDAVPFFEIGLGPIHGNQANYAAIQIAGLSGAIRIYRP